MDRVYLVEPGVHDRGRPSRSATRLHLEDSILEVPISAMLILSLDTHAAGTWRIVETLVGAGAGLLAGLVFARPRVQPAAEAIDELCRKMAGLLEEMSDGLRDGSVLDRSGDWLGQARRLAGEVQRVDDALREAEESVRLNPRGLRLPSAAVTLRLRLETLEHAAIVIRALARSIADSIRLAGDDSPMHDPQTRDKLAEVLRQLAAAVRTYGRLASAREPASQRELEAELAQYLAAAQEQQDQLSELLRTDPVAKPVGWPLRGELISHLDRLRNELLTATPEGRAPAPAAAALVAAAAAGGPLAAAGPGPQAPNTVIGLLLARGGRAGPPPPPRSSNPLNSASPGDDRPEPPGHWVACPGSPRPGGAHLHGAPRHPGEKRDHGHAGDQADHRGEDLARQRGRLAERRHDQDEIGQRGDPGVARLDDPRGHGRGDPAPGRVRGSGRR